tara:strand:- start:252 stop:599 length:348 start_codon:yes stop_codon:yes gene_type:complete
MATYSKVKLTGASDGLNNKIASTTPGAGDTVHTAHATALDEVWLYACNSSTSDVKLTIEWGATSDDERLTEVTIGAEAGWVLVIPGLLLSNSKVVYAFAATANVINVNGYINRIA